LLGKIHTLLFRKWKNRVKGRDWFDFEWYIRKDVPLHLGHLESRARDSRDWKGKAMKRGDLIKLLQDKVDQTKLEQVKDDVVRCIAYVGVLDIWSKKYFHELLQKLRI
jgi:hypothetical protein